MNLQSTNIGKWSKSSCINQYDYADQSKVKRYSTLLAEQTHFHLVRRHIFKWKKHYALNPRRFKIILKQLKDCF